MARNCPARPLSSWPGRLAPGPVPTVPPPPQPQHAVPPVLWPAAPAGQRSGVAGSGMLKGQGVGSPRGQSGDREWLDGTEVLGEGRAFRGWRTGAEVG